MSKMATRCFRSIQGLALRVGRLDSCCSPVTGTTCDFATSESFVTLNLTAQIEDPDEFIVKLANGKLCINEVGCATLKRFNVEIEVCNADPDLFQIVSGVNTIVDFQGSIVGFEIDQDLGSCNRFSLEFWTKVVGDACVDPVTGATQYLYWLLPCVSNGRIGDVQITNGPLTWKLTGEALPSKSWGVGPYNVVPTDINNTPGPLLSPIGEQTALHVQFTTIAPPVEVCGCQQITG
jgi:hypothetical protein